MSLLKPVRVVMEDGTSFTGLISLSQDTSIVLSGNGVPTITPNYAGQGYLDRTGAQFYVANNLGQWEPLTYLAEGTLDVNLSDLNDVNIVGVSNNQVLAYNSTTQQWYNYTLPAGFSPNIITPTDGQSLVYDGTQWVNDRISFFDIKENATPIQDYLDSRYSNPATDPSPDAYGLKIPYISRTGTSLNLVDKELDIGDLRGVRPSVTWLSGQVLKAIPYTPGPGPIPSGYTSYGTMVFENEFLNLEELGNVNITNPSNGQSLKFYGGEWVNDTDEVETNLANLTDVTITSPTLDQVLTYNGTEWVNSTSTGGGATTLDGLTDVSTTLAAQGDLLTFDGTDWVNLVKPSSPGYILITDGFGGWTNVEFKLTGLLDVTGIGSGSTRGAFPRWDGTSEYITPEIYRPRHLSMCLSNVPATKLHVFVTNTPNSSTLSLEPIRTYTSTSPQQYVDTGMIVISDIIQTYGGIYGDIGYLFLMEDASGNYYEVNLGYDYSTFLRVGSLPNFQFDPSVDKPTVSTALASLTVPTWSKELLFTNSELFVPNNSNEVFQIATIRLIQGATLVVNTI